ncbi:MAG: GTPase Era [Acidimicrobiia bacterium]
MRSGLAPVVGRPNVGKSTLVNALVGSKVAITSARPQTTRNAIRGVLTLEDAQIVFVDTPGLHRPRTALGERLNRLVYGTLAEADVAVFMLDATQKVGPGDRLIAERLRAAEAPTVVAVNKVDAASRDQVGEQLLDAAAWDFDAYVPVSALNEGGLPALLGELVSRLPEGPAYFPAGMHSDQPEELLVAEVIREKFLARLREELPHSLTVVLNEREERPSGTLYISARLIVERESQKGIVIGKGGELLRAAGAQAREELEALFGTQVFLDLRVKVERDWQRSPAMLERLGF